MTISRELRIPVDDVSRLSIICGTCKGEVVIDLTNKDHVENIAPATQTTGATCSLCGYTFGKEAHSIRVLQGALDALKALGASFHLADPMPRA